LLNLANRDGDVIDETRIVDQFPKMGCEVEEVAAIRQHRCGVCGKIIERTEAQGEPLNCSNCGTDFRDRPDAVSLLGESRVVRLDMLAIRPDIFDPGGMGRYMRGFLGSQTGLVEYAVSPAKLSVAVDPRLSNDDSYRPFISCAVIRNVQLNDDLIKMLMNLQEDLHWALGRNRKLASIGVYDLDTVEGVAFRYDAVAPDELKFVPLGFDPKSPASQITPGQVLEKHKTGIAFAHLLKEHKRYPLLRDELGTVLSMPPIINSESTRVTLDTKQFFCDVTGTSQRTVDRALNILVTSLKELMPGIEIEAVTINAPDGRRTTPDLSPAEMTLDVAEAAETIGIDLDRDRLTELLGRMGHGVAPGDKGTLSVQVSAWRNDVMHPVDLIEDAAVAYGYDNLVPELVPTFTVGQPREIEERSAIARRVFVGLGFHQVLTLTLTSKPAAFEKWRIERDPRAVELENPISTEQTIARVNLLPGLLETLAINKQYDLPQHLFEVGDCCFVDESVETGAREERFAACAMIGTHVGYADIRAVFDAFTHEMGGAVRVEPTAHPSFIPSRVAAIVSASGERIGTMGELHPEVLESFGLKHPASVMELSLAKLLGVPA
jgi:phenylalanyl-tRNA synthetase beta chain